MRIIVGIILALGLLALGSILNGLAVKNMLNVHALLTVLFSAVAMSLWRGETKSIGRSYLNALRQSDTEQTPLFAAGNHFLLAGLFGGLLGLVHVAHAIGKPDIIGPAFSFSIFSIFYGALGYLLFSLCFVAATGKIPEAEAVRPQKAKNGLIAAFFALFIVYSSAYIQEAKNVLSQPSTTAVFTSAIVAVQACVFRKDKINRYFEATALLSGIFVFVFGMTNSTANLSDKSKIFGGIHQALLGAWYTLLCFVVAAGWGSSAEIEHNAEYKANLKNLVYYAVAAVCVISLGFGFVIAAIAMA